MSENAPRVLILGTRGVPAAHGGFETFAERLALHLVERGWSVTVYCQTEVAEVGERFARDVWRGVERVHVAVATRGPVATLEFDWHATRHAAGMNGVCLVLGYNSGLFLPWLRAAGRRVVTNMDGFEWKRSKWSLPVRGWFYVNEWIAARASHRLVADHPAIADHLARRRHRAATVMIPYGGTPVDAAPAEPVRALGLEPDAYLISIARIEPENSILPIVEAFSRRPRGVRLAVLGTFDPAKAYHRAVRAAASEDVIFPGAIYDPATIAALRFHTRAYLHGHTVGGTNPSLVEALWAGNAVIAHDNVFNRWTAGEGQFYFGGRETLEDCIASVLTDAGRVAGARRAARLRAAELDWKDILAAYEQELADQLGVTPPQPLPELQPVDERMRAVP